MTATPLGLFALTDRPAWMDQRGETATCAEIDPDLWFPEKGATSREAKRLCRSCPLLAACRQWALTHPSAAAHGIWGGMTERERKDERKRRALRARDGESVPSTREAA